MRSSPWPRRGLGACFAACLLGLALAACGIDQKTSTGTGTPKPVPDITGIWHGEFLSAQDGGVTEIQRLTFIRSAETTYAVDFDIEYTLEGYFLWYWTNRDAMHGSISDTGDMFLESDQGALTMSAHIDTKDHIKGNWLLRFPIENDGTWEVFKIAELDP